MYKLYVIIYPMSKEDLGHHELATSRELDNKHTNCPCDTLRLEVHLLNLAGHACLNLGWRSEAHGSHCLEQLGTSPLRIHFIIIPIAPWECHITCVFDDFSFMSSFNA